MSWTREEEKMLQWAIENHESPKQEEQVSYWEKRCPAEKEVDEFDFETIQDIQALLKKYGVEKQPSVILSAAIIQEKKKWRKEEKTEPVSREFKEPEIDIPDYVYIF